MSGAEVGVVGLGNMGSALASNLVATGHCVLAHDVAGPSRTPAGAAYLPSVEEVARRAPMVVLSLPDGAVVELVVEQILKVPQRRVGHIIDTSTIGVASARETARLLASHDIGYVEAPVSGGVAGARARSLAVICAGPAEALEAAAPILAGLSDHVLRVSEQPGAAQALKLANNFLSATALAATSEAVAFGLAHGLDMATMLDALNVSSGRSAATQDKFPTHVLTERYASGFANSLMAKDLRLYLAATADAGTPARVGEITTDVWERFTEHAPGVDFTRIFSFVRDG
ncbi:MAG TPA: NAD(P)-dependent oxidoreductase [Frankiaceae bacterium]|jgi:3-hydroxyisobutyrate dehydrogenase-like beta-hydroxyacid dehydrogenase|nr:NAD(P)-dependent oxidoreductase [Frankiaceae bacterium]